MLRTSKQRTQDKTAQKVHVKKNDTVRVLTGKDRGKEGRVLRVMPSKQTAIVEQVNFVKKHSRRNPQKNQQGGIIEREAPIHVSNLKVISRGGQKGE